MIFLRRYFNFYYQLEEMPIRVELRKKEVFQMNDKLFKLQISAFFLFSNIRKGRLLYIHPVGWLVGWSVGWSTSPLIFSIYTGIKALY